MQNRLTTAALGVGLAVAFAAAGAVYARDLGSREAREAIAGLLGRSPSDVRVKSIAPAPIGGDAVVTAQMDVAFQLRQNGDGAWQVVSVRLGDGRWEDVETLRRAVDAEKALRAAADLRALAAGVEAYRRDRGFYPEGGSVAELVDRITPQFLPEVIRVDPWNQPYFYSHSPSGYRLGSVGPDGRLGSPDDVLLDGPGGGAR